MSFTSWLDARIAKAREDAINQLLDPVNIQKLVDPIRTELQLALTQQTQDLTDELGKQTNSIVANVAGQFDTSVSGMTNSVTTILNQIKGMIPKFPF